VRGNFARRVLARSVSKSNIHIITENEISHGIGENQGMSSKIKIENLTRGCLILK